MSRSAEQRLQDVRDAIAAIRQHLTRGDLDELEAAGRRLQSDWPALM